MLGRAFEHVVVVLVAVEKHAKLWADKAVDEVDIALSVFLVDSLEGASVVDVLHLAQDGGRHGKQVTAEHLQPIVLGLMYVV